MFRLWRKLLEEQGKGLECTYTLNPARSLMIDDIRKLLAEIKEREAAATPGPWTRDSWDYNTNAPYQCLRAGANGEQYIIRDANRKDADFIAAARTDIPRLVQALEGCVSWLEHLSEVRGSEVMNEDAQTALADALAALKGEGK